MRTLALGAFVGVCLTGILPAWADSVTTRIEPRPFYGATVTLEEGVRVFRPLPPHDRIIINPNNTPVYLGFNDSNSYGSNQVTNIEGSAARGSAAGIWGGGGGLHGRRHGSRRHGHMHGHRARGAGAASGGPR
jgi:hypothetical protein